ncbi:Hypothetical predicted protein [Paramuricea clavata]|uniref:Uncharacterized protein n=1 Tax=Paramuricea clavata TaxID=317549 RepID=A0A6S7JQQ3_PARCT|nr:Hypothetical predicted protein [Paramuricea clavata]
MKIHGESTPVPKQWNKYISNVKNKVSLCAFLTESFCEIGKRQLQPNKQLVIGGGMRDGDLALSVRNGQSLTVPTLVSDHEADMRIIMHAKHACEDGQDCSTVPTLTFCFSACHIIVKLDASMQLRAYQFQML